MKTIGKPLENEIIIDRSKFICHMTRINSIEEGIAFVNSIRKLHPNANHHCSAMIYHNNARSNDDGEPSGTAGVPMLNVMKHNDLDETVAVVTRYFGGVKLGAGGLIRAYSTSVSETFNIDDIVEVIEMTIVEVTVDYANANTVSSKVSIPVQNTEYMSDVLLTFYVEPKLIDDFLTEITNLTNANFTYQLKENIMNIKK